MSAPSSRCGAVVSQSEKARNANSFFDRITALLDDESVKTTNRDDVDPQLRGQMRLATDHLQQMIRFARKFHQYRFSDDPLRCEKAGEAAWMLVQLHNKLHRGEVGTEFLKMVTLFDRRAKLTPQPDFFGFHHKSWAGVVNKIMLQHYCPFDDAFEASASPDGDTEDEQGIEESESSLWTPEAFSELCQRFDEHPSEILSFNASSWPVEWEAGTLVRIPKLSEKQYLILETMNELAALSADTRQSAEDIAVACDGKQADVNVFKPLLSDLTKNHKLTESKTGRGGGSWLNDNGVEVANRLVENRKASVSKR